MKILHVLLIFTCFVILFSCHPREDNTKATESASTYIHHIVLFNLNDGNSDKALEGIKAFTEPLANIEVVKDFDFGVNSSPEGLDKGFDYSLIMKFETEYDRDSVYLPHPIHQEFVDSIQNHISDVIVFDLKKE